VSVWVIYFAKKTLHHTSGSQPILAEFFIKTSKWRSAQTLAVIVVGLALIGLRLPSYHFGEYDSYYIRIKPLIFWAGLIGLQTLCIDSYIRWIVIRENFSKSLQSNRGLLQLSSWVFLIFIFIWLFISQSRIGISGNEDYWYETGVPILPLQMLISLIAGLGLVWIENKSPLAISLKLDRWLVPGIWLVTALLWGFTPVSESYFNPKSLPPNYQYYPYSDAADYDLQSQYVLIGQGLNNGKSVDNPIYPAFLVLIHLLSGQNYARNMALQSMFYAVFPVIAYLIGKELFGRGTGVATAVMLAFRGYNSIILMPIINLSNPKQMLIDFPTAIAVSVSTLILMRLWKSGQKVNFTGSAWHGVSIGLAFLIRPTALALLLVAPIAALFRRPSFISWFRIMLSMLAGFILVMTPWAIRNEVQRPGNGIKSYFSKINLVIDTRFRDVTKESDDGSSGYISQSQQNQNENKKNSPPEKAGAILNVISNHFFHNLITSVFVLPVSSTIDDLFHTIKSPNTVWTPYWNGGLTIEQIVFLTIVLIILAIGMASAWRKNSTIGLIPLISFFVYQLANSIGRTSGGRYIVPTDWIIVFYFAIGLMEIWRVMMAFSATSETIPVARAAPPLRNKIITILLILILGAIPALIELPFHKIYIPIDQKAMLSSSNLQGIPAQSIYSNEEILNFLRQKGAVLLIGRAMYPKYFNKQEIAKNTEGMLIPVDYPHLEFSIIGPGGTQPVVFATHSLQLQNTASIIVLGCKNKRLGWNYVDAIKILGYTPETLIDFQGSNQPLQCPFIPPVCDGNGNCK